MPRIRSLKPDFWDHERIARLSRDSRLLFLGMISQADDYGTLKAGVNWIRARVFPYDDDLKTSQVAKWIKEIENQQFIGKYVIGGESFYKIRGWEKHQKIDHPGKRINPDPPKDLFERVSRGSREGLAPEEEEEEEEDREEEREEDGGAAPPYAEIVADLNLKAKTSYRDKLPKTRTLIAVRWKEGFRLDDFKTVHSKKCADWLGADMAKYLRPETLYGTKFESYLNQLEEDLSVSPVTRHNRQVMQELALDIQKEKENERK